MQGDSLGSATVGEDTGDGCSECRLACKSFQERQLLHTARFRGRCPTVINVANGSDVDVGFVPGKCRESGHTASGAQGRRWLQTSEQCSSH